MEQEIHTPRFTMLVKERNRVVCTLKILSLETPASLHQSTSKSNTDAKVKHEAGRTLLSVLQSSSYLLT